MRGMLIRALDAATAWLNAQNARVCSRRVERAKEKKSADALRHGETLCPDCVFIYDDRGELSEAIDCQTNRHHLLQRLNE